MRVAVVLHDLGKVKNVVTPGAHGKIGSVTWVEARPAWLTDAEADLVTFLIRNHDVLSFLNRGISTANWKGRMAPCHIREELARSGRPLAEALALVSTIYSADICSVPTLRGLRRHTMLLERAVLADTFMPAAQAAQVKPGT